MKKLFITLMVITMTLVLTACSTGSKAADYEGVWKYQMNGRDYTVELKSDGTFVMKMGEAKREGTYTTETTDNVTMISLNYNNSYGYMKWTEGKMCAYENGGCSFYFER